MSEPWGDNERQVAGLRETLVMAALELCLQCGQGETVKTCTNTQNAFCNAIREALSADTAGRLLLEEHHGLIAERDRLQAQVAQMREALALWLRAETEFEPQSLTMQREARKNRIAKTESALQSTGEYHNPADVQRIAELKGEVDDLRSELRKYEDGYRF